jgi:hypothetical protein
LVNSLPKSGTNLLASILDEVPGISFQKITLNRNLRLHPLNFLPFGAKDYCLAGVDQPAKVKTAVLRRMLAGLQTGHYTSAHLPYDPRLEKVLEEFGIRAFFVIRDPRDIALSQVNHVMQREAHFLHEDYKKLAENERLLAAIRGFKQPDGSYKGGSIAQRIEHIRGWMTAPSVMVVRFEDMIGAAGGGDAAVQQRTIREIGQHAGIELSAPQASEIGERAFGKGVTFHAGQIGKWRGAFDDEAKAAFKTEAGQSLIELGYAEDNNW